MTPRSKPAANDAWSWEQLLDEFLLFYAEELFWSLTPRQIDRHLVAARKRKLIDRNIAMEVAFIAAAAPHQKTPVKLKDLLIDVDAKPRRRQSPEEIKAMLMLALGGPKNGA